MLTFIRDDGSETTWLVNVSEQERYGVRSFVFSGESKPNLDSVVGVYADGHELSYVLSIFTFLPQMTAYHPRFGRGITWRGDFARFIYDNL